MSIIEYVNGYFNIKRLSPLPNTALFLVGSNPLPGYTAVMALKPQQILLLGTSKVESIINCLKTRLSQDFDLNDVLSNTCNPADSNDIRNKTECLLSQQPDKQVWLFYTAGTKSMSVHGHEAWKEYVGEGHFHWAAYLSSDGPKLWFDKISASFPLYPNDRYAVPEPVLNNIIHIHQIQACNAEKPYRDFYLVERYSSWAEKIHDFIFSAQDGNRMPQYLALLPPTYIEKVPYNFKDHDLKTTGDICCLLRDNFADDSLHAKFSFEEWKTSLNIEEPARQTIDNIGEWLQNTTKPSNAKKRQEWRINILKWMATEWLETWVARHLADSNFFHEIHESLEYKIQSHHNANAKAEVDVCGMRGHTPFVFSCTVDDSSSLGKHKLFEVRLRANQLGGEHARSAVVCLSNTPRNTEDELNQGWTGYGIIKVFGLDDIRNSDTFKERVGDWIRNLEQ